MALRAECRQKAASSFKRKAACTFYVRAFSSSRVGSPLAKIATLPQQFPYSPRPRLLALSLGGVIAAIAIYYFDGAPAAHSSLLWLAANSALILGLVASRASFFRRFLLLTESGKDLPTGVGRLRSRYIPYSNIRRVWQIQRVGMPILRLATDQGKFDIVSGMFADYHTYVAIANFPHSHAQSDSAGRE